MLMMLKWFLLFLVVVNLVLTVIVFSNTYKEKYQSEEDVQSSELEEATKSEGYEASDDATNYADKLLSEFQDSQNESYQSNDADQKQLDDFYGSATGGAEGYDSLFDQEASKESFRY